MASNVGTPAQVVSCQEPGTISGSMPATGATEHFPVPTSVINGLYPYKLPYPKPLHVDGTVLANT